MKETNRAQLERGLRKLWLDFAGELDSGPLEFPLADGRLLRLSVVAAERAREVTPTERDVLKVLAGADGMTAAEIIQAIVNAGGPKRSVSAVYKACANLSIDGVLANAHGGDGYRLTHSPLTPLEN